MSTSETLWAQTASTIEVQPGIITPPDSSVPVGTTLVTAVTVGGLGTGRDGTTGLIRAGSTPFEFMPVTYDATYGHWVSPEQFWSLSTASPANSSPNPLMQQVNAGTGTAYGPLIPWSVFNTAGLTLQLRYITIMLNQSGGANVATATPKNQGIAAAGAVGSGTAVGSAFTTNSTTAVLCGDTAETSWRTANASVNTFCLPTLELVTTTSPGNTNSFLYQWTVYWRYIG